MLIPAGKFNTQLKAIQDILIEIKLHNERNYLKGNFTPSDFRNKSYIENWQTYISQNYYDFLLEDSSIFLFKNEAQTGSYIYFECPYECQTYEDFGEQNSFGKHEDYKDLYYEYLMECNVKEAPLMIRYDYDHLSYKEGFHPASHFHIGFNNNTRIGIPHIINPLTFVLFIIRQHYNTKWLSFIDSDHYQNKLKSTYLKHKSTNEAISEDNWKQLDISELHFI
ncbi:DUF2290 domain-containing protein [Sphingobacterium siyangense]|uniref:DUF2290 domain-containing protein n=1 Tax=Sphingobacterium siyangense TaxID=459529 RepID=UPI003DA2A480